MKERLVELSEEFAGLEPRADEKPLTTDNGDDGFGSFVNEMQAGKSHIKSYKAYDFKRIGTFHSVFLKILKEDIEKANRKYTKNFSIFDTSESKSVINDILKKLWVNEAFKAQEVKGFISKLKNEWIDPKTFNWGNTQYDKTMGNVYLEYQKALEQANALDFDDLLMLPYLLFKHDPAVLEKWQNSFRYIMVDEAQDTNRIQFELMKMLSQWHNNITFIGDDFQSIYGRRWALMENFLNVKDHRPDMEIFKLQINYRSRPHIVHAWNAIIKQNQNQYKKNITAHREWDDKITVFSHRDETDEAINTIELIKRMKDKKFQSRGDISILYRTNAQSSPFEQILLQEWIPYKVRGAYKFFERKEIKDILAYIKYLANPKDNVSLKRIINTPSRKIGKTTINAVEEFAVTNDLSLNEAIQSIDKLDIWISNWACNNIKGFLQLMQEIINGLPTMTPAEIVEKVTKKIGYRAHLIKEEWWNDLAADERFENIWQLINMAGKYSDTWVESLRLFMEEVTLLTDIATSDDADTDAIKLMTVHSSKGLEFPFVFVVGLEDQIFPLANAVMEPKLLEEERRLMYVAITRAEDHLFLSHANSRMQWWQTKMNPPSRFIEELPAELLKTYDLTWWQGSSFTHTGPSIDEWDGVRHKLFGAWYVLEVWNNQAIVKFHNPKFGVRKIETRFLELT